MNILSRVIIFKLLVTFLLINACATNPTKVSGEDAQRLLPTKLGTVIDIQPVAIKGKKSNAGATVGAIIGGIAGSLVDDGEFREILMVTGATIGGIIGYYMPVKLGQHNGFQYVISVDGNERPFTVIQGGIGKKDEGFEIGQRVTIVLGRQIRVLPGQV
mgnify:CR=1 FL=1